MRRFALFWNVSWQRLVAALALPLATVTLLAQPGCSRSVDSPAQHQSGSADHDRGHPQHDEYGANHEHEGEHAHDESHAENHRVEVPADFSDALRRIRDYRIRILDAMQRNTPHDAHEPLDEMDEILGALMPLARASGVPKRDWEATNLARREFRAQFDRLHAAIDAEESIDVAPIAQETEALLARLEAISAQSQPHDQDNRSAANEKAASQEKTP